MTRVVALLRGVNLAGKRRVAMPELRDRLTELGYEDVQTYVASGNVLLSSSVAPRTLERKLTSQLSDWLGFDVPVLVRTRAELAAVVKRNPLGSVVDNPARYQVAFLSAKPKAAAIRKLEEIDVAPEQFVVHGRELYAWYPGGSGRSKLAALLTDSRLGVGSTARNWNTVTKLLELADDS